MLVVSDHFRKCGPDVDQCTKTSRRILFCRHQHVSLKHLSLQKLQHFESSPVCWQFWMSAQLSRFVFFLSTMVSLMVCSDAVTRKITCFRLQTIASDGSAPRTSVGSFPSVEVDTRGCHIGSAFAKARRGQCGVAHRQVSFLQQCMERPRVDPPQ